jgi:hypothetical protein
MQGRDHEMRFVAASLGAAGLGAWCYLETQTDGLG